MAGRFQYQHADSALVRAVQHSDLAVPPWPDLTGAKSGHMEGWCTWLREVWALETVAAAIEHASPVLARQMEAVCRGQVPEARQARRMVRSVARYVLRMTGRATPFGLFAGVTTASFGRGVAIHWGGGHRAIARAGGSWLAEVIAQLESCERLLERLPVVRNNLCFVRGGRLVVPYQSRSQDDRRTTAVEVSIRYTAAVKLAVHTASSPVPCADLVVTLSGAFPATPASRILGLLSDLVLHGVLISSLNAPSTVTDAFSHLLAQLEAARASDVPQVADVLGRLREIEHGLRCHNRAASVGAGRSIRRTLVERMAAVSSKAAQPIAVDVRLDCSLVLPQQVAREAEAAAAALARLTAHPFGTPAWQSYHNRFFERYGIGALVPLLDVVDADVGLGFPAGYAGSTAPEPPGSRSARDERLLALAQTAALDGRDEIVVDERLIDELAAGDLDQAHMPPDRELCFEVHAPSGAALDRGEFELGIVSVSRGVGTMAGRFIGILDRSHQRRMAGIVAQLPASDPDALRAQLSFPPLAAGAADVTRAPELLPQVISLSEHRDERKAVIRLADLAVACDSHRLYLASLTLRRRLEPMMLHALDLRVHTPPLARFLAEVTRAQLAVFAGFDWGAARALPFLPRVRYRRMILSPARWLLARNELPGRDTAGLEWESAFAAWSARRRLPDTIYVTEGDRRLRLDLRQAGHRALLRAHLSRAEQVRLTEAPGPDAYGWFGGRAHEISLPLMATHPARWAALLELRAAPVIGRDHGHLPGASRWLYAKLYGHRERQAEILAEHLHELLSAWDEPPLWWFVRYRDPEWHLRLRIALPDTRTFGLAAHRVSTWADCLRRRGLLRDVQFATYRPETGRWGGGAAMAAAEEAFAADSRALVAQFAEPATSPAQALCAAHFVAIAAGFTGSVDAGMKWLIEHARPGTSSPRPQPGLADLAVHLADPLDDWAALRASPGGESIIGAWRPRRHALADYRARLCVTEGGEPNGTLVSLLHAHHIRAVGIDRDDELICLRLARAAALAWEARTARSRT